MKNTFAVGAVLVVSMLQGCAQLSMFPGGASGCASSNGLCKVDIGVPAGCTSGACVSIPPEVRVGDGTGAAKDVNLLWRLPHGYAFCDGDGIRFKTGPGSQFSDPYSTDDPNGGPGGNGIRKNFHWKDANSAKGRFGYGFSFHTQDCKGAAFARDPDVVNDM